MFLFKSTGNLFANRTCFRIIYKRFGSKCVRVRFAPSPTGALHLGGLRTALYNHLFAKSRNGVTILRIEDTDLTRKVPGAAENLIEDLAWCGITYDEGPYFQSERKEIYKEYVEQLLDQGDAYYCFCSNTRLDLIRREAVKLGEIPRYDNNCRSLSKEEVDEYLKEGKPACVRFKLSSNFRGTFTDLIYGSSSFNVGNQEGDPVIFKSDGMPTYHFANVVDDHLMKISHVLRGSEWLISTPKHLLLYKAFKWDPPQYGHFPLLLNPDRTKLSKRQGSIHVRHFREKGYLPNSVLNFIIRFGGGFDLKVDDNIKIYSLQELSEKFNLSSIKSSSAQLQLNYLEEYNRVELLQLFETKEGRQEIVKKVQELVQQHFDTSVHKNNLQLDNKRVENIFKIMRNRIHNLNDLVSDEFIYLWIWDSKWSETDEIYKEVIKNFIDSVDSVGWTKQELSEFFKNFCAEHVSLKRSDVMQTMRRILTGKKVGPSIPEIMTTLSKEDVLYRLSNVLESRTSKASQN